MTDVTDAKLPQSPLRAPARANLPITGFPGVCRSAVGALYIAPDPPPGPPPIPPIGPESAKPPNINGIPQSGAMYSAPTTRIRADLPKRQASANLRHGKRSKPPRTAARQRKNPRKSAHPRVIKKATPSGAFKIRDSFSSAKIQNWLCLSGRSQFKIQTSKLTPALSGRSQFKIQNSKFKIGPASPKRSQLASAEAPKFENSKLETSSTIYHHESLS